MEAMPAGPEKEAKGLELGVGLRTAEQEAAAVVARGRAETLIADAQKDAGEAHADFEEAKKELEEAQRKFRAGNTGRELTPAEQAEQEALMHRAAEVEARKAYAEAKQRCAAQAALAAGAPAGT